MTDNPDSLTIREALNPWKHFVASDGIMSMAVHTADELAARLGLNPDMLVSDLHPTPTDGYLEHELDREKYPKLYEVDPPYGWAGGEFKVPNVTPPSQDGKHDSTTTTG